MLSNKDSAPISLSYVMNGCVNKNSGNNFNDLKRFMNNKHEYLKSLYSKLIREENSNTH